MSLFALPVTVSDLTTLQQGITFSTDTAAATAEAAQINNGADTVCNYAVRLLNSQISGSQVAMAVDLLMFGVTDNVAELSKLTNQFLPAQAANAVKFGFNPTVYAAESLRSGPGRRQWYQQQLRAHFRNIGHSAVCHISVGHHRHER